MTPKEMLDTYRKASTNETNEMSDLFRALTPRDQLELIWYQMQHFTEAVKAIVNAEDRKRFDMDRSTGNVGGNFN